MTGPLGGTLTNRTLGDFTVGAKLGEGGHGVVYRAEQRTLGRAAVIKVLHARHGTDPARVRRFLREAQLASRLDHPYAAHIYAFGAEPDGLLWIAMELVRGTGLRKVLDAQPGGRLPLARMVHLLDGLCEVVHTAHELGIVHRDLKPDNVMVLARAGRLLPKLLDLGIAKLVTGPAEHGDASLDSEREVDDAGVVTRAGALLGSPYYMAPEQWLAGEIDARTDQYALGVVAYEMIAGEVPFDGGSLADIARRHLRDELPALPEGVPAALGEVLARAMAKRPDDRFPDVLAFAAAVRGAAGLRIAAEALPRFDDDLRAELAWLPQPIADAVAELEAARNPHQARDAVWQIVRVVARWLGLLALCARSRTGAGAGDDPAVTAALRELYRRDLDAAEWVALARALVRSFADARDAHPVPELVELALAEPSPFAPLFALHASEAAAASEESLRDWLARALPVLAPLLRALGALAPYQLLVSRGPDGGDSAEVWMGTRRTARPVIAVAPGLPAGEAVLADLDGRPVLQLAPVIRIAAPAPGAPDELFWFAGAGRIRAHGARLVAEPHGFEQHDDEIWRWLRAGVLAIDDSDPASTEHTPFRGLAAFTEADAATFFGRERAARAFVNQLLDQPLLAVVGPSGTGKSSFVRAGVIPALPAGWRAEVLRPGAAPLAALAARLASSPAAAGETVVVVIDQLEELFTLCRDPAERERFAAELARLAGSPGDRTRVVLAVRDDFLARIAELAALRDRLARAVTLLATPATDDLVRVLVEPARRAGYDFDPGLAERMVETVAGRPGALALLSFTALRLWQLRDRHFKRLTAASYDAIGGVEGALASHAEDTLRGCTAEDQRLVRDAFRHLVTAEGTRAQLARDELEQILGRSAAARAVIDRLIDARLVVVADADAGDRVEIIHEALLVAWPRLVAWRRDDLEGAALRDQLRAAARQWQDRGRPRGLLWRDEALDDYLRWRARRSGALPALDQAFGDASARDAARGRRVRRGLAGVAAAIALAGVIALSLLYRASQRSAELASAALVDSWIRQGQRELFAGDYLRALPYLAQAYRTGDRSLAVRAMLHRALRLADHPRIRLAAETHDARFRAGGREVIAIGAAGDAAVIDAATGAVTARLPPDPASAAPGAPAGGAISDDGALAALPRDGGVAIWDGASLRTLAIRGAGDWPPLVGFTADRSQLAVADGRGVALWDLAAGAPRWSQPVGGVPYQVVAIGARIAVITARPTGERVAWLASADGVIELGPARRIARLAADRFITLEPTAAVQRDAAGAVALRHDIAGVTAVANSGDGRRLAFGLRSGVIEIVDAQTGARRGLLAGHTSAIQTLAFSSDGARLISMAVDRNARIWDLARSRELFHHVGLDGTPVAVQVSPDGRWIAAATSDALQLFPIDDPSAERMIELPEQVGASALAAGGTRIVTTSDSGVELWDARSGARLAYVATSVYDGAHASPDLDWIAVPSGSAPQAEIRALPGGALRATLRSASAIRWAVFDHAGARVATGNAAGLIELWSLDGARLGALRGHTAGLHDVEFSPDDRYLLSASNDRTARLWDVASGAELVRVEHRDEVDAARFDPSGARFATGSADKTAVLWNAATGAAIRAFPHEAGLRSVGLDARYLAGATASGAIQLWDVATGREAGRFQHTAIAESVDFDGDRMLTTAADGRIAIWDVSATIAAPDDVVARVCALIGSGDVASRDLLQCPGGDLPRAR